MHSCEHKYIPYTHCPHCICWYTWAHKRLQDGKMYRDLQTVCTLHIGVLHKDVYTVAARHTDVQHSLSCTHNTGTHTSYTRPCAYTQTHKGSASQALSFPCSCAFHPPHRLRLQTGENVPGGLYLLFFVPLLISPFAFWA